MNLFDMDISLWNGDSTLYILMSQSTWGHRQSTGVIRLRQLAMEDKSKIAGIIVTCRFKCAEIYSLCLWFQRCCGPPFKVGCSGENKKNLLQKQEIVFSLKRHCDMKIKFYTNE